MPCTISGDHSGTVRITSDNDPFVVLDNRPRAATVHMNGTAQRMKGYNYIFGTWSYDDDKIGEIREIYGVGLTDDTPNNAGVALTNGDETGVVVHRENGSLILHIGGEDESGEKDAVFKEIPRDAIGQDWVRYTDQIIGQIRERADAMC
jgi:hypothetical protein